MRKLFFGIMAVAGVMNSAAAEPQAEVLDRGVVAVGTADGVLVSWRSLKGDAAATTFDVYRNGVKINAAPIADVTNYLDAAGTAGASYEVKASGVEGLTAAGTAVAWEKNYMKLHLNRPEGGSVGADGDTPHSYTYAPDDCSVGDVDGDGVYEIFVKWVPSDAKDSASKGFTGPTIIDCYRLDGTQLWRIDLGHNIRSGNHYTQFMVYDFDGDGCAEMICKTAPGTKDGKGNWVLMEGDKETDDYRMHVDNPTKIFGHVRGGAEYLTCFSGKTGEELSTIAYKPGYDYGKTVWGDDYCNRADRYLGGVAYLDGERPSVIMARGYYRAAFVWAVNFRDGKLEEVWFHESNKTGQGLWGEGAHALTVGDVDGDGKDEIVYGAASLDHDGTLLYRTNPLTNNKEGHGDALHLAKMLPDREGLQVFMPHEDKDASYPFDTEMRDARTGEIIFFKPQSGNDIGRGIAANVSAAFPGYEYWAASDAAVYSYGKAIAQNRPPINFRVYWDGDLLDELLDGTGVSKPESDFSRINTLVDFSTIADVEACNGTKATPCLQADLMGDWREEIILRDKTTLSDLYIFSTTHPTKYKLPCLMQDHQYRMAIAWQNTAYNQPPHLSYCPEDEYATNASILLREGAASQIVNLGEAIEPVTVALYRAESLTCSELPAGLKWEYDADAKTGTLSGTPEEAGDYTITISSTGAVAESENASLVVKIKVIKSVTLTPMAYYSCDNPGETLHNTMGGDASLKAGSVEAVAGMKGNAVELKDNAYYVHEPDGSLDLGSDDFTVELWMKSKDDAAYLLHAGSHAANAATGATGNWMGIEYKNAVLYFAIDDDKTKSQAYVKEADKWMDGEWHHIACVRDTYAKTLHLYVDGQEVATGADNTGAIACKDENFVIGNYNVGFDNAFAGTIDELYIYSGAMPAEKVAERYATMGKDLAYFPLDEVGATTPNMVYGEAVATDGTPEAVAGVKDGAARFTGGAHYVQEAYDALQLGQSSFTVDMWMKSTDADAYIFFKGSHSANADMRTTGHWIGLERKNNYLCFSIDDDVKKTDCKLADANYAFDNQWHHVACVRDSEEKTMTLYIDGVEVARTTNVGTGAIADNNEPLRLAISDEAARPYEGDLDEFTIRPVAMSADEIKALYTTYAGAGIGEVTMTAEGKCCYLVDPFSGAILAKKAGGNVAVLLESVKAGVYVVIVESATGIESYKYVKR